MNPFKRVRQLEGELEDCRTLIDKLFDRISALEDLLDVERVHQPNFV